MIQPCTCQKEQMITVEAWTDYPLDHSAPDGSVYHIQVLLYDGNKYVDVQEVSKPGVIHSIKSGYVYTDAACVENLPEKVFAKIPVDTSLTWPLYGEGSTIPSHLWKRPPKANK